MDATEESDKDSAEDSLKDAFPQANAATEIPRDTTKESSHAAVELVHGVLITSNGDQQQGKDKYIAMTIPRSHAIFQLKPTALSTAMGLELLVSKTTHASQLAADPETHRNRTGAYLHLPVSADEDEFGFLGVFLDDMGVGAVNVVRRDGKRLTPRQVEALAVFARFHLAEEHTQLTTEVFGSEEEEKRLLARKEWVKTRLTREEFERFFEGFRRTRMKEDASWADVVSPYEG
jgi:hypothetical protein